jgi:hypothetical protein
MREQDKVQLVFDDNSFFVIDCTTDISPQYQSRATQHTIEDGSTISDQIITEPVVLSLVGMQSELEGQTGAYDPDFIGGHIELDERLLTAWRNRETLYVDTRVRGVFAFMAITSYAPTTSSNHGKSLHFTLTLQELSFSETQTRNLAAERLQAEQDRLVAESKEFWEKQRKDGTIQTRTPSSRLNEQAERASLGEVSAQLPLVEQNPFRPAA